MANQKFKAAYVPRPARLVLHREGARVIDVALTNDAARALSRAFTRLKESTSPELHDRDVVEAIIAMLMHTAEELRNG